MGEYVINGERITTPFDPVTAGQLKDFAQADGNAWVMVTEPDGGVRHVRDTEIVPATAERVSVIPAFVYGDQR